MPTKFGNRIDSIVSIYQIFKAHLWCSGSTVLEVSKQFQVQILADALLCRFLVCLGML